MTAALLARCVLEGESPRAFLRVHAKQRIPTKDDVEFELERHDEHDGPEGHFTEQDDVDWVRQQLENGNEYAWFVARVVAKWTDADGKEFEGDDYLGGCSYRSRADFLAPGGCYDDMKDRAYDELVKKVEDHLGIS